MSFNYTATLDVIACADCGIEFGVPDHWIKRLRTNGDSFFCPRGHTNVYRKTELKKLKLKLDRERDAHERTRKNVLAANQRTEKERRSHSATKGRLTKTHNRIKKGVCPFCNRHFGNLQRHMETKHKESCHGD